jgi:hypothetical protein
MAGAWRGLGRGKKFCSNVLKKRACSSLLMVPKAGDKLLVSRVFENVTCCFI